LLTFLIFAAIGASHYFADKVNGSKENNKEYFDELKIKYKEEYHNFQETQIRSITTGNFESRKLICFLHGAPGSWNAFDIYLSDSSLMSTAQLVSIDRLGYGDSDYRHADNSIQNQTDALHSVLNAHTFDSLYLVGHSYGGPIVGNYAARYPALVKAVLMIAPVINPDGEKDFWFNQILKWKPVAFLLPGYINVSVSEKLNHAQALREIENNWSVIQAPVIHLHCSDDWIAPSGVNVEYSKKNIPAELLEINVYEGDGHLIPFVNQSKVNLLIQEMMNL